MPTAAIRSMQPIIICMFASSRRQRSRDSGHTANSLCIKIIGAHRCGGRIAPSLLFCDADPERPSGANAAPAVRPALTRQEQSMRPMVTSLAALAIACALSTAAAAQDYNAIVSAPDRSETDRNTDKRRDPVKLLTFAGVKEGMTVLDMEAGAGYTTELLARAVGPAGRVYAQDSADVMERQV